MPIIQRFALKDATEQDVLSLEGQIGGDLPKDYRTFLLEHNGGEPNPSHCQNTRVRAFFSLDRDDPYYPIWEALYDFDERLPAETLPIACDVFGNLILLGFAGDKVNNVYFWDHEREDDENLDSNITLEAPSFTSFIDSFDPLPLG